MWPVVRKATGWVLDLQTPRGEVAWERDAAGRPGEFALLSGCASILQGLCCATALAELVADPQPDWELAAGQLGHVLACHPEAFADKSDFAMDWYYPVLAGALRGAAAAARLAEGWDVFVVPGLGVRCVSDQPWVTVAETCELVMSLDACGRRTRRRALRGRGAAAARGWLLLDRLAVRQRDPLPRRAQLLDVGRGDPRGRRPQGFSGGAAIFRDGPGRTTRGRPPTQKPAAATPRPPSASTVDRPPIPSPVRSRMRSEPA